jgi:hypothetical protein
MSDQIEMARQRLPEGDYRFNENPPCPKAVRWWVDNGMGGGWLVWAYPDWDGEVRNTIRTGP